MTDQCPVGNSSRILPALAALGTLIAVTAGSRADEAQPSSLSVGPAVQITPRYPGVRASRMFLLADVEAESGDWYISGTDLIGLRIVNRAQTKAGVALEYDFTERRARDVPHGAALRDVHTTPRFKVFVEQDLAMFAGTASMATDVGAHHEGTIAQAQIQLQLPVTKNGFFTIGPGVTWSDSHWMRAFYGVSAEQSAQTGLTEFDARPGVSDIDIEAVAGYQFSKRWSAGFDVTLARLERSAANSPFTVTRSQTTALVSMGYKIE
jgi:MipA family protein